MRFTGWICSAFFIFMGLNAAAQTGENCISQQEMNEIASHFTQFSSLANKGDVCLTDSPQDRLLTGIMFMRKTRFAANMPNSADELFSGKFASNWYQYFVGRIDAFEVEDSCPKGVVAFVYFFGNSMYVCPMALTANFTSLDLASVFMHEARHIDGFPHITCSRGPRAGIQGACDQRISDGGSYSVTVETYAQLAKYAQDIHPALKAYARASSVIYADEAFETPVRVDKQPQFMVMTNNQEFHLVRVNGSVSTQQLGHAPALGHIAMRAQHMVLYPDDKSLKAKFVFARDEGELNQEAGDTAVDYNSLSPQQRANWVDVHIGAQWNTKIYKDKITFACDPRAATTRDLPTSGEVPVAALYPNGYDRAASSAHLLMESGKIFEFGCSGGSPFLRASSVTFDQTFKRIYKAGNETVGLGQDGKLYRIQGSTSTPLSTSLDGRIYELVPNNNYSFFD